MSDMKINARMTDAEMEQVVGGLKYYDLGVYASYRIYPVDGGRSFTFRGHSVDETVAASILFYKYCNTDDNVKKWLDKGWDAFEQRVMSYRASNSKEFEAHYMAFREKEDE